MKGRRKSPDALTEDEVAFLRSDRTPAAIRQFAARQHESLGVRTTAFRKVAAAARAERDALMEVAALEVVRAASEGRVDAARRLRHIEDEKRALEDELAETRGRLRAATARPALAVYADGTGQ